MENKKIEIIKNELGYVEINKNNEYVCGICCMCDLVLYELDDSEIVSEIYDIENDNCGFVCNKCLSMFLNKYKNIIKNIKDIENKIKVDNDYLDNEIFLNIIIKQTQTTINSNNLIF